ARLLWEVIAIAEIFRLAGPMLRASLSSSLQSSAGIGTSTTITWGLNWASIARSSPGDRATDTIATESSRFAFNAYRVSSFRSKTSTRIPDRRKPTLLFAAIGLGPWASRTAAHHRLSHRPLHASRLTTRRHRAFAARCKQLAIPLTSL